MKASTSSFVIAALALLTLTAASPPAVAQTPDVATGNTAWLEASGGVALPLGDLGDVQDPGPAVEVGGGYWIHPRVAVRADGSLEFLEGSDAPEGGRAMPDMNVLRFHGGVDVIVLSPRPELTVLAGAGAGAAVYDTDRFAEPVFNPATNEPEADFNETYFTSSGRLKVVYTVKPRIGVFGSGGARVSFADADDTALFGAFDPDLAEEDTDLLWTIPVSAGVEVRF